MKKKPVVTFISILCAFAAAMCLFACGEKDEPESDSLSVSGNKYTFDSVDVTCDDESFGNEADMVKASLTTQYTGATVEFKSNGTYVEIMTSTVNGTYEQSGATVTATVGSYTKTYTVSGDYISTFTVIPLSASGDVDGGNVNDGNEADDSASERSDANVTIETKEQKNAVNNAPVLNVTIKYKKGSGNSGNPPDDPSDGTVWCKHEDGDLVHLTDGEESTCEHAGWTLDIYVCAGYDKDPYKGEIFCGKIFESKEAAERNESVGAVRDYELEGYDFSRFRKPRPLAPHTPVIDAAVPGTCTAKGKTEGSHCGVCNAVIKAQEDTEFGSHDYSYKIKVNGAQSLSYNICSNCGKFENEDISYKMTLNAGGESYMLEKASGLGLTGDITLPHECNGKPVTVIGKEALKDCSSVTSLSVPFGITTIAERAFMNCTSLVRVSIPNSVTNIGLGAFARCSSLKGANIPDSVTNLERCFYGCTSIESLTLPYLGGYLGSYFSDSYYVYDNEDVPQSLKTVTISSGYVSNQAFKDCTGITNVNLGTGVTHIYDYAFYGCTGLTEMRFSDGLKFIGEWAFCGCTKLEKLTNIPDSLEEIRSGVFKDCVGLKNINIGSSYSKLSSVWYNAFDGCSIQTAKIPAAATHAIGQGCKNSIETVEITCGDTILYDAFENCTKLTDITIPDSVTKIEYDAFKNCSLLTSITIPAGVTSIGNGAFSGCNMLIIYCKAVSKPSEWSESWNCNCPVIWNCGNNNKDKDGYIYEVIDGIRYGLKNGTAQVTGSNNKNLNIPSSVSYNNDTYRVTSISEFAFPDGYILASIKFNDIASYCGISGLNNLDKNKVFIGDQKLQDMTSITIPNGVTSIDNNAFYGCSSLTSITIPNSVMSIGCEAFGGCSKLKSITLPFVGATKEGTINTHLGYIFGAYDYQHNSQYIPTSLKTVIITGGESIDNYAFCYCSSLMSITIPNSVTSIGDAFSYCSSLTSITIPNSVTSIGRDAFRGCSKLESITLPFVGATKDGTNGTHLGCIFGASSGFDPADYVPSSLKTVAVTGTSIGRNAFSDCSSLTSIAIFDSITSIGQYAFYNCNSLTSIKFNDIASYCEINGLGNVDKSKVYIGNQKLYDMANITIPSGVTGIGEHAFYDCSNLTDITIPDSVVGIGNYAFGSCSSLTSIKFNDIASYCGISGLSNLDKSKVFIGDQKLQDMTSITIPSGVTSIGYEAFRGCSCLVSVAMPNSLTNIESYAFYGCSSLMSISIPNSVTNIGGYAFRDCSSLTSITVAADNPNYASQNGILYNKDKTEFIHIPKAIAGAVTIPDGVTSIGYEAFRGSDLTSITIPESVIKIEGSAFKDCNNLMSAKFLCPSGWVCSVYGGISVDLSDDSKAAEYLRDTYSGASWKLE